MTEIQKRTADISQTGTDGCRRTRVISGFPMTHQLQGDLLDGSVPGSTSTLLTGPSASTSRHSYGRISSFSESRPRNSPRPERLVLHLPAEDRGQSLCSDQFQSRHQHQHQHQHRPTSPLSTTSSIRSSPSPSSSPNRGFMRERKRTPPLFTSTPLHMRMNPAPKVSMQGGGQLNAARDLLAAQSLEAESQRSGKSGMLRSSPCSTPCLSPSTELDLMEITSDEVCGTPPGSMTNEVGREAMIRQASEEEHRHQKQVQRERQVPPIPEVVQGEGKTSVESGSVSLLTAMMQEQRKKETDRQDHSRPSSSQGPRQEQGRPQGAQGDAAGLESGLQGVAPSSVAGSTTGSGLGANNTPRPILVCQPGSNWQSHATMISANTSVANSIAHRTSPSASPNRKLAGCSILRKPSDKWLPCEANGSAEVGIQPERPASPRLQAALQPLEEVPASTLTAPSLQVPVAPRKSSLTFAVVPPTSESSLQRKVSDGKNASTSVTFKTTSDDVAPVRRVLADEVIMEDEDEDEDQDEGTREDRDGQEGEASDEDIDGADRTLLTRQRSRGSGNGIVEQDEAGTIKDGSFDRRTDLSDEYDDDDEDEDEEEEEDDDDDDDASIRDTHRGDSYDANLSEQPTPMSEVVDSMSDTDGDEDEEEEDEDDNDDDLELNVNGTASGYEEDSEAGFSSDDSGAQRRASRSGVTKTLGRSPRPTRFKLHDSQRLVEEKEGVKETKFVSPRGRRGLYHVRRGKLVMEERDAIHTPPRERRLSLRTQQLDVEVEDATEAPPSHRHHRYAFARPTNYRRRRPVSEVHEEIVGGSASSLISPGSFVRIGQDAQAEVERGRGAVQIQHALPPRVHNATAGKSGNDSCTRHRSPPPRARTKHAQLGRSVSDRASWMVPPAGLSPSAGRLKIKRGVSDSPRKRRAKEVGYGTDVLALGRRSKPIPDDSIVEEDPSAMSAAMTTTENETTPIHPGPSALAKLSAQRGWRSDDAVFAAPTVKRQVAVKPRLETQQMSQPRRRPGPPPSPLRPTRTMTSASSSRNESACESDQTGLSGAGVGTGHRSASERMVNGMINVLRRASGSVQPFFKTEGLGERDVHSPVSPDVGTSFGAQGGMTLGLDTASLPRPCEVAIDMTPALGIKAGPGRSSAPAQQVLHQTLNSRASSPWSPLMSSDETAPGPRSARGTPEHHQEDGRSVSGYMTEPVKLSFTEPGRRGSQPEVRVTSRPIQCPLPKRGLGVE